MTAAVAACICLQVVRPSRRSQPAPAAACLPEFALHPLPALHPSPCCAGAANMTRQGVWVLTAAYIPAWATRDWQTWWVRSRKCTR